ncbi:MAG: class I SAM-dependent methyltransferase [Thermoplasmatales archaeon]|nr:class I SAM-dependent methyltransferase [Thermoplasmatales archaeon]
MADVDPYWSILVDPSKIDNKWNLDEFYSTGRKQVKRVMDFISQNGITFQKFSALDYGCGVGRLSEALADVFSNVTGVDFSRKMINLAKAHNRYGNLNYEVTNVICYP